MNLWITKKNNQLRRRRPSRGSRSWQPCRSRPFPTYQHHLQLEYYSKLKKECETCLLLKKAFLVHMLFASTYLYGFQRSVFTCNHLVFPFNEKYPSLCYKFSFFFLIIMVFFSTVHGWNIYVIMKINRTIYAIYRYEANKKKEIKNNENVYNYSKPDQDFHCQISFR